MRRNIIRHGLTPLLDIQELGAELHIYGEIDHPHRRHFNPSIVWDGIILKIAIRSCNFAVKRQGNYYFRDGNAYSKTDILYGDVDPDTLTVANLNKLTLSKDSPTRTLVSGIEDIRLFSRKDGVHAVGFESDRLTKSLHNASASLAEYLIKGNELVYLRTLEKPDITVVEKNWCPPDVPRADFDFTYSPTQVWKDGKVLGKPYNGIIHGGSQLLQQKDGTYLSLVHDKVADPRSRLVYDRFVYRHYLAQHDKNGIITHLSKPFRFGTHENIEFGVGMVEYKDDFIISVGIHDAKYALVKIKRETLEGLMNEIPT